MQIQRVQGDDAGSAMGNNSLLEGYFQLKQAIPFFKFTNSLVALESLRLAGIK